MGDSRQSVQVLQSQLDEFRDRSRRELQDAQRLSKDRLVEQQRAQALLKTTQEEVRQTRFHYIHIVLKYNIVFIVQKSNSSNNKKKVTSFMKIKTPSMFPLLPSIRTFTSIAKLWTLVPTGPLIWLWFELTTFQFITQITP